MCMEIADLNATQQDIAEIWKVRCRIYTKSWMKDKNI